MWWTSCYQIAMAFFQKQINRKIFRKINMLWSVVSLCYCIYKSKMYVGQSISTKRNLLGNPACRIWCIKVRHIIHKWFTYLTLWIIPQYILATHWDVISLFHPHLVWLCDLPSWNFQVLSILMGFQLNGLNHFLQNVKIVKICGKGTCLFCFQISCM